METIVCKSCGGSVTRQGNYYICDFCASKWMIDSGNDISAVARANAWSALREGNFEKAAELFESIIVENGNDHEGYWGRALALNGIVYVDDVREGKKVPTCNNITENSFLEDKDVQKAITLAPDEIKKSYQAQAEQIEKIREEWINVASKEPPYDVFISFKDSDKDRGIDRTQDSIDAQDIYTGLVDAGYKVFYSRVSLRGKVSEQYEPYIYNAIKTAKVMIVFGEKPEYFSSTWIKNEWSRFRARIEKGEKHKNSLVVVVKDMNPNDLPVALKSRQAMNMADLTFFETLKKHIKRVIDESNQAVHLDKIEIKGGQIAKKSATIKQETIKKREIGQGVATELSIDEKQKISLIYTFLEGKEWRDARELIEDELFNNPNYAEMIWLSLCVKFKCINDMVLSNEVKSFEEEDFATIQRYLNCAGEKDAATKLDLLYNCRNYIGEQKYVQLLDAILPYDYANRNVRLQETWDYAIDYSKYNIFSKLLTTLESGDVEKYIEYNEKFMGKTADVGLIGECIENILKVDEGNVVALRKKLAIEYNYGKANELIETFENLLRYSTDAKKEVVFMLDVIERNKMTDEKAIFANQLLKYYPEDLSQISDRVLKLAYAETKAGCFQEAEFLFSLLLQFDNKNAECYWGMCLVKLSARDEQDVLNSSVPLKTIPEYRSYLTLASPERRQKCMQLSRKQIDERVSGIEKQIQALNSKKRTIEVQDDSPEPTMEKKEYYKIFGAFIWGLISFILFICSLINMIQAQYSLESQNASSAFALSLFMLAIPSNICVVKTGAYKASYKAIANMFGKIQGCLVKLIVGYFLLVPILYIPIIYSVIGWCFAIKTFLSWHKQKKNAEEMAAIKMQNLKTIELEHKDIDSKISKLKAKQNEWEELKN